MSLRIGGGVRLGAGSGGGALFSGLPDGLLSSSATDMDAARGITINESEGRRAVSAWDDQISSRDAAQATVGDQPEYFGINPNFNGAPTVTGNGTSYQMDWDPYAAMLAGDDTPSYRCIAMRAKSLGVEQHILGCMQTTGNSWMQFLATSADAYRVRRVTPNITYGTVTTNSIIMEIVNYGTTVDITIDGVATITAGAFDATELFSSVGTILARRYNGTVAAWANFDIARILLDPNIPTVGDRTTIRTFLGDLYGISTI